MEVAFFFETSATQPTFVF